MLVMAETAKKLQSQFTTNLINPRTHRYKSILTGGAQRLAKPHILNTTMIRVHYRPDVNNCMRLVLTLRCSMAQYITNGSYQYSYMCH